MGIPKNLTREHILQAIADLDAGMSVRWGKSRKYDLVYEEETLCSKAVLGLAICIAKQCDPYSLDFDGWRSNQFDAPGSGFEKSRRIHTSSPHEDSSASKDFFQLVDLVLIENDRSAIDPAGPQREIITVDDNDRVLQILAVRARAKRR